MNEHLFALLLHEEPEPSASLQLALRDLSVETYSVATCREAADLIRPYKPHIVFTANSLTDDSWLSILNR